MYTGAWLRASLAMVLRSSSIAGESPSMRDGARAGRLAALCFAQAQRRLHQPAQHGDIDRLGDEIERAGLERIDGGVDVAVRGDHRHRRFRILRGDQLDDFLTRCRPAGACR